MVDHAHSCDVRTFDVRTFDVRTIAAHAFHTLGAGTLKPESSRCPRPYPPPSPTLPSACGGGLGRGAGEGREGAYDHGGKSQSLDFSRGQIAALFVLFASIVAIPLLLHPLPPISDYINHLSRMHVIATIGSDSDLARFYQVNWAVIPNLMMDMILPALVRIMSIYAAGQAYMIASFVLILSGTFALNRQLHGRWSVLPLAAFPLLYNYVFLVGTMNYVSGIGLSLWALVTWIALRERNLVLRLTVSAAFVAALFFCHLYALGTYGLGLLAFELHRLWSSPSPASVGGAPLPVDAACEPGDHKGRSDGGRSRYPLPTLARLQGRVGRGTLPARLLDFVATGLPFLPVLPLLMMSPTWGLRGEMGWELAGKIDGLLYVINVYSGAVGSLLAAVMAAAAGFMLYHRALRFHAFGFVLLAVGAIVYMALPRVAFDTYMADQRLPISLAFMVIACAQLDLRGFGPRHAFVRRGAVAVLFLLLAARVLEVQTVWAELSPGAASFRQSVALIDRGAKVMVAYADPDGGDNVLNLGLVHAACLAVIERSALVTTVFTVVGKQVLHVRADYRDRVDTQDGTPPTIENLLHVSKQVASGDDYWRRWTKDYDYLYVLFTDGRHENPDPARLTPIFAGEKFMLYRIENAQIADAGRSAR
jgi:hypothetical protein